MYFQNGVPAATRGFSHELWNFGKYGGNKLDKYLLGDLSVGFGFVDDFTNGIATGVHTVTQATTGTFTVGDAMRGVALVDCDSNTVTQGVNVQRAGTTGEMYIPTAKTCIWMEGRMKAVDIGSSGPEFFFGLAVKDTSIIGSSAISAQAIGFKSETDNSILLATCKDGSSETTAASIHTFVEDTYVHLGFRVTDASLAEFYVNGAKVGQIIANIPATELIPSIVVQSDGAVDTIVHLDWWAAFQGEQLIGNP